MTIEQPLARATANETPGNSAARLKTLMHRAIAEVGLNLADRSILTEAASGAYAVTPVIAAMAGARQVNAFARATSYGSVATVAQLVRDLSDYCDVGGRVTVIDTLTPEILRSVDIVTNSGHLRPLNRQVIDNLRSDAVIALMFEAWEFRPGDIDLGACLQRGIPVVGVNERHPAVDVFAFLGPLCIRQMHDCGLSVHRNHVAVLCDNDFVAFIARGLSGAGANVHCFRSVFELQHDDWDAVVVALRPGTGPRIGPPEARHLAETSSPGTILLQFWGDIDRTAVRELGMHVWPPVAPASGHMGILLSAIGPEPIVRLQTGGLRAADWVLSGFNISSGSIAQPL